jgi:hypothetical protein
VSSGIAGDFLPFSISLPLSIRFLPVLSLSLSLVGRAKGREGRRGGGVDELEEGGGAGLPSGRCRAASWLLTPESRISTFAPPPRPGGA